MAPKMAVFGHIWPYLPIGGPSYLKLVGHCLNKVEHCIPHLGGGMDPFGHIKNCPVGEGKAAMAKYCQIQLKDGCFRGPLMPSRVILVGHRGPSGPPRCGIQCSTVFNRCSTNLRQVGPLMAKYGRKWLKLPLQGPSEAPHGHFGGWKGVQVAHPSCGLQCSTRFNQCSTKLRQLGLPMAK